MNRRPVASFVGAMLALVGLAELIAGAASWGLWGPDSGAHSLLLGSSASLVLGGFLWLSNRSSAEERTAGFHRKEALAAVGLGWPVIVVFGALPFVHAGSIPNLADAIFESASGFTTTGATILSGDRIDGLPSGLALWRALTQWLGGAGIVVVLVAILPMGGRNFFQSEVAGFDSDVRSPLARESARETMWAYLGLTLLGMGSLWLAGMTPTDAVLHALTTVATGGFSNHGSSLAHYDTWSVQGTVIGLMFLAGMSFSFFALAVRRGPGNMFRSIWKSTEWRVYVGILLIFSGAIAWMNLDQHADATTSIRHALFQVTSIGTSTGFASTDWNGWSEVSRALLLLLIMSGACVGSTSGGIKLARVTILAKAAIAALRRAAVPRRVTVVRMDGATVSDSVVASIFDFALLWTATLIIGALALTACGMTMIEAVAAAGTCLGNIGPGIDRFGPANSFGELHSAGKLIMSALMLLGRLEFYALLVALLPRFWKD
jgi:trk system potassium uptake protein TrkH